MPGAQILKDFTNSGVGAMHTFRYVSKKAHQTRGLFGVVLDRRTRNAPLVATCHALAAARLTLSFVPEQVLRFLIVDSAGSSYETAELPLAAVRVSLRL
jgi:hypothetical protein